MPVDPESTRRRGRLWGRLFPRRDSEVTEPAEAAGDDVRRRDLLREVAAEVGECEVRCATLFVSRPTRTGAEYEPFCRVQLAG